MKGHIRERSPGRWAIIIDDTSAGERKRRWHSFAGTKRQAQIECARLINEVQTGSAIAPNRITVAGFLEQWLAHVQTQVTPKTFERYRSIVRVNINPALGTIGLVKLQPVAISRAYSEALGRLAPRTVHHTHRVLSQALRQAVRWRTACHCRERRADQAGIRYKTPKSGKGRMVALPGIAVVELAAWRLRQAEELLRIGVRLTDDNFICAREDGAPIQPNSIGHAWERFLGATDLPRIRFHDLRHSHATALLAAGVHPKVASERLGHSRVALTLDTYSHVIPGMQEDAVKKIDAAFTATLTKRG